MLEDFKALRRKLFSWHSERCGGWRVVAGPAGDPDSPMGAGLGEVDPLEYLSPFLEAVRNPEVNGPITLVALTSLERILRHGLLGACGAPALPRRCSAWQVSLVNIGVHT